MEVVKCPHWRIKRLYRYSNDTGRFIYNYSIIINFYLFSRMRLCFCAAVKSRGTAHAMEDRGMVMKQWWSYK
jgi:hypothetical protein